MEEHIFFATSGFSAAICSSFSGEELMVQVKNGQSVGRDCLVIHPEVLFGSCGKVKMHCKRKIRRNSKVQSSLCSFCVVDLDL